MSKFLWNIMAAAILVHWNLEIVLSANLDKNQRLNQR